MPKPRTPTDVLKARGSFEKNPQRERSDPPTTGTLGEPPTRLNAEQRAAWEEVAKNAPVGVLRSSDRIAVEQCARLLASAWDRKRPNPSEDSRIGWYLVRFGMTSSDRSKFGAPEKPKPQDDADKYLQ